MRYTATTPIVPHSNFDKQRPRVLGRSPSIRATSERAKPLSSHPPNLPDLPCLLACLLVLLACASPGDLPAQPVSPIQASYPVRAM
ncbi:hypothetical protein LX32DRAFT_644401 [Colletotrichum zoysiae]|uniref:Uncharacterized protein n=1 Tax=Colletotrichum zoysiae TaxID=1216348 RepID=A0AAD9H708_9PEZI|nr:hypothetical protein LX32DRAFT_644401 [Colletotrichum zoysiae]